MNYNGARYLSDTLAAVRPIQGQFREILLVDNGSTDGSLDIAERAGLPNLTVVALGENRGPGAARNEGLRRVSAARILFIDNDIALHSDCSRELAAALDESPDASIAMARVLFASDPETIQFDGAGSHFIGLMTVRHGGEPLARLRGAGGTTDAREYPDNGSLVSACFMVDRGRWGTDPLFDEELFLYLEDHEAGLRARLLGHRIVSAPAALCYHGVGTPGISIRETGSHSAVRVEQTIQNRWALVLKLYSPRSLLLLSPSLLLFEVFQAVGSLKKGWFREWRRAVGATLRGFGSLRRRRRAFQAQRRLPDGAVLEGGPIPFNPATHSTGVERAGRSVLDAAVGLNWRLVRWALGARSRESSPARKAQR